MDLSKLLIANRGEIAIRIIRAAEDLDLRTAAIFSEDDAASPHVGRADEAHPMAGSGGRTAFDMITKGWCGEKN